MRHHGRQCAQNGSRERGGGGAGGRLEEGQPGNGIVGLPRAVVGDEIAQELIRNAPQTCTRHPPADFHTPPPRPPASYGVRRSRHYARGITVSQPPRQPHGLAILTTSTATSLTGPWPLTSSIPSVTRHDNGPASSALSARSAQGARNTKAAKPRQWPTVPAALRGRVWVRVYICGGCVSLRMRHFDVLRGTKELGGNSGEAARRELRRLRRWERAEGYVSMGTSDRACKPVDITAASRPFPSPFSLPSPFSFPFPSLPLIPPSLGTLRSSNLTTGT